MTEGIGRGGARCWQSWKMVSASWYEYEKAFFYGDVGKRE